ncbi:MAG: contact-dependent growth inhibition system immunity protein [Candidatus Dormibacteria bacterium]
MHGTIDIDDTVAQASRDFPALAKLFGGYFHQDWHEEHATTQAAVSAFLRDAPPTTAATAVADLDRLLDLHLDESALQRVLSEGFDCNYVPEVDERRVDQWLLQLRDALEQGARG